MMDLRVLTAGAASLLFAGCAQDLLRADAETMFAMPGPNESVDIAGTPPGDILDRQRVREPGQSESEPAEAVSIVDRASGAPVIWEERSFAIRQSKTLYEFDNYSENPPTFLPVKVRGTVIESIDFMSVRTDLADKVFEFEFGIRLPTGEENGEEPFFDVPDGALPAIPRPLATEPTGADLWFGLDQSVRDVMRRRRSFLSVRFTIDQGKQCVDFGGGLTPPDRFGSGGSYVSLTAPLGGLIRIKYTLTTANQFGTLEIAGDGLVPKSFPTDCSRITPGIRTYRLQLRQQGRELAGSGRFVFSAPPVQLPLYASESFVRDFIRSGGEAVDLPDEPGFDYFLDDIVVRRLGGG